MKFKLVKKGLLVGLASLTLITSIPSITLAAKPKVQPKPTATIRKVENKQMPLFPAGINLKGEELRVAEILGRAYKNREKTVKITTSLPLNRVSEISSKAMDSLNVGSSHLGRINLSSIGNNKTITVTYRDTDEQYRLAEAYIKSIVDSVPKEYSTIDKIAYVYRVVADHAYTENINAEKNVNGISTQVAYSLINGGGHCSAYVDMFNRALEMMGIKTIYLYGVTRTVDSSGLHAWSGVEYNGKWYLADPTFAMSYLSQDSIVGKKYNSVVSWDYFMKGIHNPGYIYRELENYSRDIFPLEDLKPEDGNYKFEDKYRYIFTNTSKRTEGVLLKKPNEILQSKFVKGNFKKDINEFNTLKNSGKVVSLDYNKNIWFVVSSSAENDPSGELFRNARRYFKTLAPNA